MDQFDFSYLNKVFKRALEPKLPSTDIRPIPDERCVNTAHLGEAEKERLEQIGLKAIAEGRVAAVVLAGGQASRLGSAQPKGVLRLGTGLGQDDVDSLLFIQAEQIVRLQRMAAEQFPAFYRTIDRTWVTLERIQFVGACNPPTDPGRNPLSARFLRHVPVIYVDYPGRTSLNQIYGTFARAMLGQTMQIRGMAKPLTEAMTDFYLLSQEHFTQDDQPHYVYSPRELTRWVRGISEAIMPLDSVSHEELVRLWAHEALRLFHDRLVRDDERVWTNELVDQVAHKYFAASINCADIGTQTMKNQQQRHQLTNKMPASMPATTTTTRDKPSSSSSRRSSPLPVQVGQDYVSTIELSKRGGGAAAGGGDQRGWPLKSPTTMTASTSSAC